VTGCEPEHDPIVNYVSAHHASSLVIGIHLQSARSDNDYSMSFNIKIIPDFKQSPHWELEMLSSFLGKISL
jgi:hypothetical protein